MASHQWFQHDWGSATFLVILWVALGMLMHFALTMLWRLAKAGFMLRLRVHSLKANGGHIASIRS